MHKNHQDPKELDLTKPRLASYKQKWKVHQDTVYWVEIQLAQRKGLKFHQTRTNAIILYDTLPAYCISKAIVMKPEEIIYQKVYVSPRPPPKISYKDNWMTDLDSEVAGSSKDTQRIQPTPKTQLSSTERPVGGPESTRKSRNVLCLITRTSSTQQVRGDPHVDQNPQSVPCSHLQKWKKKKRRMVRPVMVEEHDIDFRVPGLSHAVVKEAEHLRVQDLVKNIENHRHREALQADLQQNNVYNHFSKNSKEMIPELGNVELFCGNVHPIFHHHISIVYSTVLSTIVHRPVHMWLKT